MSSAPLGPEVLRAGPCGKRAARSRFARAATSRNPLQACPEAVDCEITTV